MKSIESNLMTFRKLFKGRLSKKKSSGNNAKKLNGWIKVIAILNSFSRSLVHGGESTKSQPSS